MTVKYVTVTETDPAWSRAATRTHSRWDSSTVALALAGLILAQARATRTELRDIHERMDSQIADLRQQMNLQIGELRERMAHLEGLLEGLREAITRRNVA